jgi:hypothetical protein
MPILSRRGLAALAASVGLFAVIGLTVPGGAAGDNTDVLQALHAGGFVVVVRHGATFPDQADIDPLNFDNSAAQQEYQKTAGITEGGLVVSPNENNRRIDAFRKMLGTAPAPGANKNLITHKPNIVDALGKDWCDAKEGEAALFRPETGGNKFIARVQMEEWPHIAVGAK